MAVPTSYFTSTKNLDDVLAAIQKAGVPPKFTYDFLKKLGFPSSNDRAIIPVFKSMGFLDGSGTPLDRYKRFRDPSQAGAVMAEGIREAYADVFGVNQQPQGLTPEQLKGVFSRLSGKSDSVAEKMALTFNALAGHADFDKAQVAATPEPLVAPPSSDGTEAETLAEERQPPPLGTLQLRHDIHIHLPVGDIGVYDAIFRALRQNLGGCGGWRDAGLLVPRADDERDGRSNGCGGFLTRAVGVHGECRRKWDARVLQRRGAWRCAAHGPGLRAFVLLRELCARTG